MTHVQEDEVPKVWRFAPQKNDRMAARQRFGRLGEVVFG